MISHSLEDTQKIANDFINDLFHRGETSMATVVGLYGNLGAGKTSFTQCIAKALGVGEKVLSPTFVIEKIYEIRDKRYDHLIHIDAYRIESSDELVHLGWKEIVSSPKNLVLIEWPERVADIMPSHIQICFKVLPGEESREIEVI